MRLHCTSGRRPASRRLPTHTDGLRTTDADDGKRVMRSRMRAIALLSVALALVAIALAVRLGLPDAAHAGVGG